MAQNVSEKLQAMGYVFGRDFIAQDDSDGTGVYLSAWYSEDDCPFPDALRESERA